LLVGSGAGSVDDAEKEVRQIVDQYHLQRSVTLTGSVSNVQDYLRASDVFIFPSHYEGFGLSIVEAMACGLPVIVTSVGVALEIVQPEQNGLLVPVRDRQQLSTAIEWMLDHRAAWHTMGAQARTDVYTRYSMDVIASQYVTLFHSLRKSNLSHFLHSPFAPGRRP
jgi:glycosyltransferase involved in cell wall biosynthesis